MLLVVNYHYFATRRSSVARAIFPVTVEEFEAQLDELAREFDFVSRDDVVEAAAGAGTAALPERACLITFDDGLRSQVELALPVLERRGIPAVFFVCGQPIAERRVLYVHKVHQLREAMPDDVLRARLEAELHAAGADPLGRVDPDAAATAYRYDTHEVASLKYLLNVVLGPARSGPVDAVFAAAFDEDETVERLYASPDAVAKLERLSVLGAHGYSHRPLAQLGALEAKDDLERCAKVLGEATGSRPRVLSYPYGTPAAVDPATARAAEAAGFAVGMTLERSFNRTLERPLLLARIDSNDAPGGRAPLFEISGGELGLQEGMSHARSRYFTEGARAA